MSTWYWNPNVAVSGDILVVMRKISRVTEERNTIKMTNEKGKWWEKQETIKLGLLLLDKLLFMQNENIFLSKMTTSRQQCWLMDIICKMGGKKKEDRFSWVTWENQSHKTLQIYVFH